MEKIWNFFRVLSFILYLGRIHATSNHDDYDMEKLTAVYSWKSLDFAWPNAAARQKAIESGEFNEGQIIPYDVDVAYDNGEPKIFVTVPRFQHGSPATLGVVTDQLSATGDPIIMPYPNWEWNRPDNCDHFTNIYRIFIDDCNRLWVLDSGTQHGVRFCDPQLLCFDLSTDELISRHVFPSNQVQPTSEFVTPIVDTSTGCLDTFVYIADYLGYQLLVYDHKQKKSWNIQHEAFNLDPSYSHITINNFSYDVKDGILSGALSPLQTNGERIFYFHTLTSVTESWVLTSVIRNSTLFINNTTPPPGSIHTFKLTRTSQSSMEAMSKDGVLFYSLIQENSLGCWNSITHPDFGGDGLETLVTSNTALSFTSGMKIRQYGEEPETFWMITVPMAPFINRVIDSNVTNFRILSNYVHHLIRGTECDWFPRGRGSAKSCKGWLC